MIKLLQKKRESAKQKVSLPSVVEDYLGRFSKTNSHKNPENSGPSLLDRIRKYTNNANPPKKRWTIKRPGMNI